MYYRQELEVHVTQVSGGGHETTIRLNVIGLRNALNQITSMMMWHLSGRTNAYQLVFEIKLHDTIVARIEV